MLKVSSKHPIEKEVKLVSEMKLIESPSQSEIRPSMTLEDTDWMQHAMFRALQCTGALLLRHFVILWQKLVSVFVLPFCREDAATDKQHSCLYITRT